MSWLLSLGPLVRSTIDQAAQLALAPQQQYLNLVLAVLSIVLSVLIGLSFCAGCGFGVLLVHSHLLPEDWLLDLARAPFRARFHEAEEPRARLRLYRRPVDGRQDAR